VSAVSAEILGSARVWRAGDGVLAIANFISPPPLFITPLGTEVVNVEAPLDITRRAERQKSA
jgi:hypothetical protein